MLRTKCPEHQVQPGRTHTTDGENMATSGENTLGEKRVRVEFNVSGSGLVQ